MKLVIWFLFITALLSIIIGFSITLPYSQKLIGFGTIGLFFVVIPLFIYYRWKDKNIKDYMLTNENLEKMRKNQKNTKNLS